MKQLAIILLLSVTFLVSFSQSSQDEYAVGEITWENASYPLKNNTAVLVQVIDPDMNKISTYNDTLEVFAYSDSYQEGITLTLYETNKDSGIFKRTFVISELRAAPNILYTREGDTLTAVYADTTLPPPYLQTDKLDLRSTAIVRTGSGPLERVPASAFRIQDLQGNVMKMPTIDVDQQILLVADIKNQYDREQDFAFFVQIQDEKKTTVSLSWITGTLQPLQSFGPSQSWIPQEQGKYTATLFVWESVENPSALSPPLSFELTVQD